MKQIILMIVCAFVFSIHFVNAQQQVVTNAVIIQLLDEGFLDEEILDLTREQIGTATFRFYIPKTDINKRFKHHKHCY